MESTDGLADVGTTDHLASDCVQPVGVYRVHRGCLAVVLAGTVTTVHIVGRNTGPGSYFMKIEIIARSCAP